MRRAILLAMVLSLLSASACATAPDLFPHTPQANALATPAPFVFAPPAEATPVPEPAWQHPISREILLDDLDVLRLANAENLLDQNYPPNDAIHALVAATVRKPSSDKRLARTVAADALVAMFEAATSDGITLYLSSAYRTYSTQKTMYANRMASVGYDDGVVAKAGASDHQTGLGFDVISKALIGERFTPAFAETKEAKWMAEHAPSYGFIIRYPKDKTPITGIIYEPWHLRYVGVEVALYMTQNALTLEEFTMERREVLFSYEQWIDLGVETDVF